MGLIEKAGFWRGLGKVLNTGLGAEVAERTGQVVNRVVSVAGAPELEGPTPWAPFAGPLSARTVALISTGGFYLDGDRPFDVDKATGDPSFRELPVDADPAAIRIAHAHYSHRYVDEDLNVLFPLARLRELAGEGVLRLSRRAFSFGFGGMLTGAYVRPPDGTAHQLARALAEDQVDLALLVPA